MRIAIAEFSQETNTFTPIPADVSDFETSTLLFGQSILEKKDSNDSLDGVRTFFRDKKKVEKLPIQSTKTVSSGKLTEEAFRYFTLKLTEGLQEQLPFDALLLSLHGATVSEEMDDVCGHILQTVRGLIGPDIPVVVPLDHHANITSRIIENSAIVVGHETQPHNLSATGEKAAATLYALLQHKFRITKAWVKIPMIAPQDQFLTSLGAMKSWFEQAREFEKTGKVLSVSPFPMQPWIDVEEGGWAVVVHTDDDTELANSIASRLAQQVWDLRKEFWVSHRVSPADAVRKAVEAKQGLVVLSDTGDAVYGGSTGDSTCLLREMVRQEIPCKAFMPVVDAQAVDQAFANGLGKAKLSVGGRYDPFSEPIQLSGQITAISAGLKLSSERGLTDIGKAVLFEVQNVKIVLLTNRGYAINQPILYTHLGLGIEDAKMVVLKTGSNFQYFQPWRRELIRADTPGTTQSNLKDFDWKKLPRPMFPLDDIPGWKAKAQVRSWL